MHNYSRSKETLDKRELYITNRNKIGRNEKEERRKVTKSIILLYDRQLFRIYLITIIRIY